ncbi:MAG: efflux RND transporter periplasmic adaptor subunit [Hyphomicrobiaceae bacterium]
MLGSSRRISSALLSLALAPILMLTPVADAAETPSGEPYVVQDATIDDLKAVYATVRSRDRIEARVRTPGTIARLKVAVGDEVKAGDVLAEVSDPKIALSIEALDARMVGLESRVKTTKTEYDRARKLASQGITPKARLDEAKTAYDISVNEAKAAEAERSVLVKQIEEGAVLAPATGRALVVPVTTGSVVMPGESIATIAANGFLLRLELPERHALSMQVGDPVTLAKREGSGDDLPAGEGRIVRVYPELQGGRVIADAEVDGLGDYYVGERARVWISAGKRTTVVIPSSFITHRFGLDLVTLVMPDGSTGEIVVQKGQPAPIQGNESGVEILAGLNAGDKIIQTGADND